ncbi:glycine--tRNA ligase subunit beta [Umboniibacter marinipuniceus]|uniref:Glycine--tRNA ligase beta subunit n=1 Tax=Umboniibacter marinipuniceus TaxID=569599 RepID=A0A3M0ABY8_9GAMM|nr:glycine--tRNA ligase subunit beta [Umboniibacter marinipuniceus]RMA82136.1 glycyl-tRNA synthetase beta chain [Umboniibacter marinipuniceus]
MTTQNILIELGTEELPPKSLKALSDAFSQSIKDSLVAAELNFEQVESFAAPRRLGVLVHNVQACQADTDVEKLGPNVKAAFDKEGNPSKAAEGFARSCGTEFNQLIEVETPKGTRLAFRSTQQGQSTTALLQGFVEKALQQLPIPKRMRWGASRAEFVRPVKWLLALADDAIVPMTVLGIESSNVTRGHRFHSQGDLIVPSALAYEQVLLDDGQVVASFEKRRQLIRDGAAEVGAAANGNTVIGAELLDEVTGLVEWPVPMAGSFEAKFLEVPAEALISSMREHQKYFHVVDDAGALLPLFVFVSNIVSSKPSSVIEGNEKVIRPRLADADFFYKTDLKTSLESKAEKLEKIVFQKQLGTIAEKCDRIAALSTSISTIVGAKAADVQRAAKLCKADLSSELVLEFDDLQGLAGEYYARHDGESAEVASAMNEHYMPRFAGDSLPSTATGTAIAIADRMDTLAGIFAIGQIPSGSKDPFALRRASIGLLRLIVENNLNLDLAELTDLALKSLQHVEFDHSQVRAQIVDYVFERFKARYVEEGISADAVNAVLEKSLTSPVDFNARVLAVTDFAKIDAAEALAAANKRVGNILAKVDAVSDDIDPSLISEAPEQALYNELLSVEPIVQPLLAEKRYTESMLALAELRGPVDAFFDGVMVNAEDDAVRANRLAILKRLSNLFGAVADISRLV